MPKKHAARGEGHDAGILRIDERTKAVMTDHPRHAQEAFKEQIARVRDVVPSCNKDDIPLVLQYYDGDVEKTIQSFVEDGGAAILQEWRSSGKKGKPANKRNKKKRKPQQNGAASAGSGAASLEEKEGVSEPTVNAQSSSRSTGNTSHPSASQSTTPSTAKPQTDRPQYQDRPRQQRNRREDRNRSYQRPHTAEDGARDVRPGRLTGGATAGAAAATIPKTQPAASVVQDQSSVQTPSINDVGQRSHAAETSEKTPREIHLPHTHDSVKAKKLGAVLEKSSKDLHRTTVALTRHKNQLRDKLDQSEKSIKKSFDELHRFLTERELVLTNNFLDVKREATDMLEGREEQAKELEKQIHRIGTMSEDQLMELRADIKHFVSDRKVDEETGKAIRFIWNPDQIIELIKNFGEVVPIQHRYSTRRPSVSSLSSINTVSRTTSVSEEPASLSRSTSLSETHDASPVFKTPPPPSQLDPVAEAAKMAARLQRSLQQGRKGPRNPRGPNNQGDQGQKDGERSHPANRGQGQGSGQGHGQGPNPNRQGRNQNRQDRQRPQEQGQKQGNAANVNDEHGQEKRFNKNMRRRQNNNRKRQEERAKSEQANGGDVNVQSQTDTDTSEKQPPIQNGPSSTTKDVTDTVPVPPTKKDQSSVNQSEEIPRSETYHIGNGEMSPCSSVDVNEQKVQIKKPVNIEPLPTTNGPLVNGDIKMNGDILHLDGHVNGDIGDALPQRESKPRRAPKMEQVVKETSALNGVVDFESAEREN